MKQFEPEQLPAIGWIRIMEIGDENIYFLYLDNDQETQGFCKVDSYCPSP